MRIVNNKASAGIDTLEEKDTRLVDPETVEEVYPTYKTTDDYSELNVVSKPKRADNENTLSYYTRWFVAQA